MSTSSTQANEGYVIGGLTISIADAVKFAPHLTFHPYEKYFPVSVETLLRGATLHGLNGDIANPTQQELATSSDTNSRLLLDSAIFSGEPLSQSGQEQLSPAPMYLFIQVPADQSYIDLTYFLVFAYNGPQTFRSYNFGNFNFMVRHWAEHQGDLESVTVRVTPDCSTALSVRYEAHGTDHWFNAAEVDWTDSTHPRGRVALNSHATYNSRNMPDNHWVELKMLGTAAAVDIVQNSTLGWKAYLQPRGIRLLMLDATGNPLGAEKWSGFKGRMGAEQKNIYQDVRDVSGDSLGVWQSWVADQKVKLGILIPALSEGTPPEAPGARSWFVTSTAGLPPPERPPIVPLDPLTPKRDFIAAEILPVLLGYDPNSDISKAFADCTEADCQGGTSVGLDDASITDWVWAQFPSGRYPPPGEGPYEFRRMNDGGWYVVEVPLEELQRRGYGY